MVFLTMTLDEKFMKLAIKEAKKAEVLDEVPVGCIIVKDNKIIARGHNLRESKQDPTMHAEIVAIRKAAKKARNWRLEGTTIYITIEPCAMCAGTILWARCARIVYGANDIKGGAIESSIKLFEAPNINHHPEITGGVLKEECAEIIKTYFKNKRSS